LESSCVLRYGARPADPPSVWAPVRGARVVNEGDQCRAFFRTTTFSCYAVACCKVKFAQHLIRTPDRSFIRFILFSGPVYPLPRLVPAQGDAAGGGERAGTCVLQGFQFLDEYSFSTLLKDEEKFVLGVQLKDVYREPPSHQTPVSTWAHSDCKTSSAPPRAVQPYIDLAGASMTQSNTELMILKMGGPRDDMVPKFQTLGLIPLSDSHCELKFLNNVRYFPSGSCCRATTKVTCTSSWYHLGFFCDREMCWLCGSGYCSKHQLEEALELQGVVLRLCSGCRLDFQSGQPAQIQESFRQHIHPHCKTVLLVFAMFEKTLEVRNESDMIRNILNDQTQFRFQDNLHKVVMDDLEARMNAKCPSILHVGCHGDTDKLFYSSRGNISINPMKSGTFIPDTQAAETLSKFVPCAEAGSGGLELVFINACSSFGLGSQLFCRGIPYVVCWKGAVTDATCLCFAEHFYRKLSVCNGQYGVAFQTAYTALETHLKFQRQIPCLLWNDLAAVDPAWVRHNSDYGILEGGAVFSGSPTRNWRPPNGDDDYSALAGEQERLSLKSLAFDIHSLCEDGTRVVRADFIDRRGFLLPAGLKVLGVESFKDVWGADGAAVRQAEREVQEGREEQARQAAEHLARAIALREQDYSVHEQAHDKIVSNKEKKCAVRRLVNHRLHLESLEEALRGLRRLCAGEGAAGASRRQEQEA